MSVSAEDVAGSLEGLRMGFRADGADLEVVSVDGGHASVRLIGTEETCWECIVPPQILRDVIAKTAMNSCPDLVALDVIDPRVMD